MCAVLGGIGAVQIGTTIAHITTFDCPFAKVTGVPCPGCGLSRGCSALLRGHVADAFQWHAFAPAFVLAVGLFLVAAVLPTESRQRVMARIGRFESSTRLSGLLLTLLVFYWLIRLVYFSGRYGFLTSN